MKKIIILVVAIIAIILVVSIGGSILSTVDGGEVIVKQAAVTGDLTIYTDEGLFMRMFGKLTKYYRTYDTYLSKDPLDGGKGAETLPTTVRFGDGGTAEIGSVTQWRLPLIDEPVTKIHRNFRSSIALQAQVRQWIIDVEKQTASIFKADETYSTRRGEFAQLISNQIINGLYQTETIQVEVGTNEVDKNGEVIMSMSTRTVIKRDKDGNPVVAKIGIFKEYGLELVNHTLKDIDYDDTIDALIAQKKKAEQEKAVAVTNAEKARQDAITAVEKGKADIAKAEAEELVSKIRATTTAQKNKEVAELKGQQELEVARLGRLAAAENAAKELELKKADAEGAALLVKAGLTPLDAANIQKETAIGVARELAKLNVPEIMIVGGGDGGGSVDPFTAVGLQAMLDITANMSSIK